MKDTKTGCQRNGGRGIEKWLEKTGRMEEGSGNDPRYEGTGHDRAAPRRGRVNPDEDLLRAGRAAGGRQIIRLQKSR